MPILRASRAGCHTSHTTDSDAVTRFISKALVVPICRECHREM